MVTSRQPAGERQSSAALANHMHFFICPCFAWLRTNGAYRALLLLCSSPLLSPARPTAANSTAPRLHPCPPPSSSLAFAFPDDSNRHQEYAYVQHPGPRHWSVGRRRCHTHQALPDPVRDSGQLPLASESPALGLPCPGRPFGVSLPPPFSHSGHGCSWQYSGGWGLFARAWVWMRGGGGGWA